MSAEALAAALVGGGLTTMVLAIIGFAYRPRRPRIPRHRDDERNF